MGIPRTEATHMWMSNQRLTDGLVLAALEKTLPLDRMSLLQSFAQVLALRTLTNWHVTGRTRGNLSCA